MAKKTLSNIDPLAKTATVQPPPEDIIAAQGIGLKLSEWAELDAIAADLGMTRHSVRVYAVRYFLAHYREGRIKPQTRTVKTLPST